MEEVQDGASELPPVVGHGETVTFGHVDVESVYGRECQAALVALVGSRLSAIGRYLVVSDICCDASDKHRVYPDMVRLISWGDGVGDGSSMCAAVRLSEL